MEIARLLVRSGAKLDLPDRNGDTLLHHCVRRGDIATTNALLDLGASIMHTTAGGRTPLHLAVSTGSEAMVTMLLDWCANEKDAFPQDTATTDTPLSSTTSTTTIPPANTTTTPTRQNSTVPTTTTTSSTARKISLLAHFIDACDAHNMTALHLSVKLQRLDVLKVLLEYGTNVNLGCA